MASLKRTEKIMSSGRLAHFSTLAPQLSERNVPEEDETAILDNPQVLCFFSAHVISLFKQASMICVSFYEHAHIY